LAPIDFKSFTYAPNAYQPLSLPTYAPIPIITYSLQELKSSTLQEISINSISTITSDQISQLSENQVGTLLSKNILLLKSSELDNLICGKNKHSDLYGTAICDDAINYYNIGMWDKETEIIFYDKNISSGISSFRNRGDQYGTNKFILKTSTPLKFVNEKNIKSIDILKIDVEGCTYEILQGFGDFIKNIKLMHIETERHQHFEGQYTEDKIFELLLNNNFKLLEHSWCCLEQYDSVWINNSI
jgi:FkbM family methyltransferase